MMKWKYYNHAAIPTTAPHEEVDIKPIKNGEIWKLDGHTSLLARWTTDFDCGYETNWYYCIKEAPYDFDELPKSSKKHIKQALRKVNVAIIDPVPYAKEIYRVYEEAVVGYKNFVDTTTEESFVAAIKNDKRTYWGAFDVESNTLVAYMIVTENDIYAETNTAKYSKKYLKLQASAALHHAILKYYLSDRAFKYIDAGERNINHATNTQEYKIHNFAYKKAYCHLHVSYNPKIKWAVKLIYPFRGILTMLDGNRFVHLINGVMKMEEICREDCK